MTSLKAKIVLITGASSGIGAGTAEYFASLGSKLSLTGRNLHQLKATAAKCQQHGLDESNIHIIQADLSIDADIHKVIEETVQVYKGLDVLVNNAGIGVLGSIETTDLEMYDKQFRINTRAPFYLAQLAVPYLKESKGTIVNVSSVNGLRAFPNLISYNMSKAALDQMTRCAAIELAQYGVRVNSVNPGVILTNIQRRAGLDEESYAKFLEHSKTTHALGRVGTPDEVAKCIAFLASEDSSFTTGATIPIDGGRHAMCPR